MVIPELCAHALVHNRYSPEHPLLVGNATSTASSTAEGVKVTLDLRRNGGVEIPLASWMVVGVVVFSGGNATLRVAFGSSKKACPGEGDEGLWGSPHSSRETFRSP